MKGLTSAVLAALASLAASALLDGCAADNVTQVDEQALENERIMGSGTIDPPGR